MASRPDPAVDEQEAVKWIRSYCGVGEFTYRTVYFGYGALAADVSLLRRLLTKINLTMTVLSPRVCCHPPTYSDAHA